jgi:3-isopropylmalate dehydratase small subunit
MAVLAIDQGENNTHSQWRRRAGVQCVIAPSYAFIYGRNQPNMGLLGIVLKNGACRLAHPRI